MSLILRGDKEQKLNISELDGNFQYLESLIGTGGGGFRFIYAAFLQEAAAILENNRLLELSKEMTAIGDLWRDFAVEASRVYKNRSTQVDVYNTLANQLLDIANKEEVFFKKLKFDIS